MISKKMLIRWLFGRFSKIISGDGAFLIIKDLYEKETKIDSRIGIIGYLINRIETLDFQVQELKKSNQITNINYPVQKL